VSASFAATRLGNLKDGRMKSREDVAQGGVAAFPATLLKLFNGENFGKLVLKVADA
jgi:NADPH-dependent curcumin reductase